MTGQQADTLVKTINIISAFKLRDLDLPIKIYQDIIANADNSIKIKKHDAPAPSTSRQGKTSATTKTSEKFTEDTKGVK